LELINPNYEIQARHAEFISASLFSWSWNKFRMTVFLKLI